MNVDIICVGTLKEKYLREADAEYRKRLSRFGKIAVTSVKEVKLPGKPSPAQEVAAIQEEGRAIIGRIGRRTFTIALDIKGKSLTSEGFAAEIAALQGSGVSSFTFIIGGSMGLSDEVLKEADMRLSFSPMTFPHQLARIILEEQLYRACKINSGETYHK